MGTLPVLCETVPVLPGVPPEDAGEAESLAANIGTIGCTIEFLRDAFFNDRLGADPTGIVLPLPLFRFLMTSVFKDSGRTTPWSFKNRPHALHKGWPSGLRRHNGVVWVKQFVHVGGPPSALSIFVPLGLAGREEAAVLKPDLGGELGDDTGTPRNAWGYASMGALGVDVTLGIFCLRGSLRFLISLTDTAEPYD